MTQAAQVSPQVDVREAMVSAHGGSTSLGRVKAGETWIFSASGRWRDGWIPCGPGGYSLLIYDMLGWTCEDPGQPRYCLMARIAGGSRQLYAIGNGAKHTFNASGDLVAFPNNDRRAGRNGQGAVKLVMARLPAIGSDEPAKDVDCLYRYHRLRDWVDRLVGLGLIAVLVGAVSFLLAVLPQGLDIVRLATGDDSTGYGGAFAYLVGLLILSLQAWTWGRLVVISSFGSDREAWDEVASKTFLNWAPRLIALLPFAATLIAMARIPNFQKRTLAFAVVALLALALAIALHKRVEWTQAARAWAGRWGEAASDAALRRGWVLFCLFGGVAAFVFATCSPVAFGRGLGSPAVVFVGTALLISGATLLVQTGVNLRIPLVICALVWALLMGLVFDDHAIGRRAGGRQITDQAIRASLGEALSAWDKIQPPGKPRVLVLLAARGGASRAGYWTAATLAHLDDATAQEFRAHLFATNSVSGGSLGAVGFAAMLKASPEKPDYAKLLDFVGRDHLASALTGLLFSDLLYRFAPLPFLPDHAETLERSWETAWAERFGNDDLARGFTRLAPDMNFANSKLDTARNWRPLLFVQGASEGTGTRLLTSALSFADNRAKGPAEIDARDLLAALGHDVAASTAILDGARFPYVSPSGTFRDGGTLDHVIDGGYFDNSGAEAIREIARIARARLGADLTIVEILVGYDDGEPVAHWYSDLLTSLGDDLLAPPKGLAAAMDGHEKHIQHETTANPENARVIQITLGGGHNSNGAICEPPMDWALSEQAQLDIEAQTGFSNTEWLGKYEKAAAPDCQDAKRSQANRDAFACVADLLARGEQSTCGRR